MCRPANGSREEACPGGHTGPPLRGAGNVPEITEIGTENEHSPSGGTRGRHAGVVVPYGWLRRAAAIALGSGAERSVCASGREEMGGNRSRDHPQRGHQRRTIPQSRRSRDSSLSTREPLGTGDADCRVASLLAMTVLILCHSEKAQRADVEIHPFYDGRGFGPPYLGHGLRRPNFVPKFGASVRSSAPMESPSQPARSEASAPAAARDGRESAQRPSQKGDRPRDCRGSALSAERDAGQIRSWPDD